MVEPAIKKYITWLKVAGMLSEIYPAKKALKNPLLLVFEPFPFKGYVHFRKGI